METKVLKPTRLRCSKRSFGLLLSALPLLYGLAGSAPSRAQDVVSSVHIYALSSGPWPVELAAARAGEDIVIRGTARFPNDCVAQAGFDAFYRDLAPLASTGTRLLLLRGRRSPQGCPDIDAPVTRPFALRLPRAGMVEQIVLLDEVAGQQPTILRPSGDFGAPGEAVRDAGRLQPLAAAEMHPGPELRFRIGLPPGCTVRDVTIEIIEGRGVTASGAALSPIPLWIMAVTQPAACQVDAEIGHSAEMIVSLQSVILQGRAAWLVNPLLSPSNGKPRLFTRISR
jgi:hypothetical protein